MPFYYENGIAGFGIAGNRVRYSLGYTLNIAKAINKLITILLIFKEDVFNLIKIAYILYVNRQFPLFQLDHQYALFS